MRIGFRIGAGFAGVVALTLVLGATGWLALERYSEQVNQADRVAEICLADERAKRAEVTISKLDVFHDAESVGVTVVRRRVG